MIYGNYKVHFQSEGFNIYPENKEGETYRVRISRVIIFLTHQKTGDVVYFKRHNHRGVWYWNDSREKNHCTPQHVQSEIGRLLFKGDTNRAKEFLGEVK